MGEKTSATRKSWEITCSFGLEGNEGEPVPAAGKLRSNPSEQVGFIQAMQDSPHRRRSHGLRKTLLLLLLLLFLITRKRRFVLLTSA
jgi:hypothetical protein